MSAPDPEGFSLLAMIGSAVAAVASPIVWLHTKMDKKADKHTVANALQKVENEMATHRSATREDIRRLYENAEADRKLVRDGFDKLSHEIAETHIALLTRMDGK